MKSKSRNRAWGIIASVIMVLPFLLGLGSSKNAFAQDVEEVPNSQNVILHKKAFDTIPITTPNTGDQMNFSGTNLNGSIFTAYDVSRVYWEAYRELDEDSLEAARITAAEKAVTALLGADGKVKDAQSYTSFVFPATGEADANGKVIEGQSSKSLPTISIVDEVKENAVYLFVETGFPAGVVQSKSAPFILGLPSVTNNNEYRSEVHVYPKNEVVTKALQFFKFGVDVNGTANPLKGANFQLKIKKGKYLGSDNNFTVDEAAAEKEAAIFTSNEEGLVTTGDLLLSPDDYEFYEVGYQEDEEAVKGYHFGKNPVVTAHVDNDLNITYDYFDNTNTEKKEAKEAEAYNYQVPEPTKTPDGKDFDVNAPIEFTIEQKIPLDIADYTQFSLVDNYDEKLELVSTEEKIKESVKIGDESIGTWAAYSVESGKSFTLDFTNNIKYLKQYAGKTIQFKATMKIKPGATIATDINNTVTFVNNFDPKTDTAKVKTYGKKFVKKDLATGETLKDAKFVVKKGEQYLQYQDSNGEKVESYTSSDLIAEYAVKWVDTEVEGTVFVSGEGGVFTVNGLAQNDEKGNKIEYSLVETEAPEGYVLPSKDLGVTFKADDGKTELQQVNNKHKGTLPSTGGMGIVAFVAVGIVAIGGAYVYFAKGRRHIEG